MASLTGEYLGMNVSISEAETGDYEYFQWCAKHDFRLQCCEACDLVRYPPTTACPWCGGAASKWRSVEGRGTIYSYFQVHHAIQSAYKDRAPYMVVLVELDTQRGQPTKTEAIRMLGNLTLPNGELAPESVRSQVGIGTRVRMVIKDCSPELALPMWAVDEDAKQPEKPWQFPNAPTKA